ncbi:MAG TPA: bifunctional phosphoribosylaminoimidazolecarboxamide formyltransferase/IMP cyclohydrolase [Atribacteraceae bacterium]|nr:bifunctional phosphoribosylaminoimidazolecarboxamide formyltransferase/IMP cyclohydrolase [Atribacteraceae bacterium]
MIPVKTALVSVSDKQGLDVLVRFLSKRGIKLLATGGTARYIRNLGLAVEEVSEVTGFPEILGGRVKTLHPVIAGGILCRRDLESDRRDLLREGISPIDLVICNLYPFENMIERGEFSLKKVIEEIDIGGITLLRASAKNFHYVVISSSPDQYPELIELMERHNGSFPENRSLEWAIEAFQHSAQYDALIAGYLSRIGGIPEKVFPSLVPIILQRKEVLRYGENPHQQGAYYRDLSFDGVGFMNQMEQLGGKELSFNNYYDTQAAFSLVREFTSPAVVVVKHNNPCGVSVDAALSKAAEKALAGDPVSAFGGVVAFNRTVDRNSALVFGDLFLEVVVAPAYDQDALQFFSAKKNLRILQAPLSAPARYDLKKVDGGFLLQDNDRLSYDEKALRVVTDVQPGPSEMEDLLFAWQVSRFVKSNAIVLAQDQATIGIGAGQMSRIDSLRIAIMKASLRLKNAVLASDAFFPFPDVVEEAGKAGIRAIIQPGGSIKDQDSIDACNRLGISMIFTGIRHFRH